MPNLPDGVEPLDRAGAFCGDEHPTAKSLKCEKRPDHTEAHVCWHNGRAVWWGGLPEIALPPADLQKPTPADLAGFSSPPGAATTSSRSSAQVAQPADLNPLAVSGEMQAARSIPGTAAPAVPSYSGEICDQCGAAQMVRSGRCLTCMACGSSDGGCS